MTIDNTTIAVSGMVCMSCVNSIESVISEHIGVLSIKVSLEEEQANIEYDKAVTNPTDLVSAIEEMGFDAEEINPDIHSDAHFETVLIDIEGMTCNSCVNSIEKMIGGREHVYRIQVSLEDNNATIDFDSSRESTTGLCDAICEMGFDAFVKNNTLKTVLLAIEGMTCQSCVKSITEVMSAKDGVKNINVSLEQNNALIEYDSASLDVSLLCQSIEDMGFEAHLESERLNGKFSF